MKTKKSIVPLLMVFGAAFIMSACSSFINVKVVPDDAPKEVKKAVRKAPNSALIGIGKTTPSGSENLTETLVVTRARALISRQLNTMVRDMVNMYQAGSTLDPTMALAFEENITVALSASTLTGSTVLCLKKDPNNIYWAVVGLTRKEAKKEIERAQELARQRMVSRPVGNNVDITVNFDKAFDRAVAAGPQF